MAQQPPNRTFEHVHDLFMSFLVARLSPKELPNVNVPKGLLHLRDRHCKRLMHRFDVGVIRPLFWSTQKSSVAPPEWDPTRIQFLWSVDTVLPAEHYGDLGTKTLQTF